MNVDMNTLETLLSQGFITLSGNNDNCFSVNKEMNIGKNTWAKIDSLKYIGYTQIN